MWLKACFKIDTYLGAKWCHGGHQRQQRSLLHVQIRCQFFLSAKKKRK